MKNDAQLMLLQDELICLRAVEPEDLEVVFQIENNSALWNIGSSTVPYSRFAIRQYIESNSNDIYADRQLRLMVELKADHRVVGCADLTNFDPQHHRAEIGIVVLAGERGTGIGTRILSLLCRYAFDFLHLHQLYAIVPADNEASLKMFTHCGFDTRLLLKEWLCAEDEKGIVYRDAVMIQCLSNRK